MQQPMFCGQQEKKQSSFFKQKPKETGPSPEVKAISHDVSDLSRRLRTLEERFSNLQTRTQITEQNMISKNKQVSAELKTTTHEINELRKDIMEIKDKILLLIKELQSTAKKEEVKILERYINLWEPLNFVTRHEFDEEIKKLKETK